MEKKYLRITRESYILEMPCEIKLSFLKFENMAKMLLYFYIACFLPFRIPNSCNWKSHDTTLSKGQKIDTTSYRHATCAASRLP